MMIFAVDDEPNALEILCRAIQEAAPEAEIKSFDRASEALGAAENGVIPDVLFADGDMPGMNGVELAKRLKLVCPNLNVISGIRPSTREPERPAMSARAM